MKIIAYLLALLLAFSASPAGNPEPEPNAFPRTADFSADFHRDFPNADYALFTAQDLTEDVLRARTNQNEYYVCCTTGTVLNAQGDGREDQPEPYNYISYRDVPFETKPGNRIVTYLVYDLHTAYTDDIIARYDYLLTFPGQPMN